MPKEPVTPDDRPDTDPAQTSEDVAGLYSWANLEGSEYRDFSASREQARATSRQRSRAKQETPQASATTAIRTPIKPSIAVISASDLQKPGFAAKIHRPRPISNKGSRWSALKNVIEHTDDTQQRYDLSLVEIDIPVVAIISFAGGVGKSTLAAGLAHSFAAKQESVLLVDTQAHGLLPFFLGGNRSPEAQNPFTFRSRSSSGTITVLTIDSELHETDAGEENLAKQVLQHSAGSHRVVLDVATSSRSLLRQTLPLSSLVLAVLTPDMASVVSLQAIEAFQQSVEQQTGERPEIFYVLNQFDSSLRLHLDIREALSNQLGERLLPFAIHRNSAVSEALADGMTVMEYLPHSEIVADLKLLTQWVQNASGAKEEVRSTLIELPAIHRRER